MNREKITFNPDIAKEKLSFEAEIFFSTLEKRLRSEKLSRYPILLQDFGEKERMVKRNLILPSLEDFGEMAAAIDLLKKDKPKIFSNKVPESEILATWLRVMTSILSRFNKIKNPEIVFEYPKEDSYKFWIAGWVTEKTEIDEDEDEEQNSVIHINLPYAGQITGGKDVVSTLLHEWLHCFFDELELRELTDAGKAVDEDHTEQFTAIEKKIGLLPPAPYGQGVPPPGQVNERY